MLLDKSGGTAKTTKHNVRGRQARDLIKAPMTCWATSVDSVWKEVEPNTRGRGGVGNINGRGKSEDVAGHRRGRDIGGHAVKINHPIGTTRDDERSPPHLVAKPKTK